MKNFLKRMAGDAKNVKNHLIPKKFTNITCESTMEISNVPSAKKNLEISLVLISISNCAEKEKKNLTSKNTNATNVERSLVLNHNSNFISVSSGKTLAKWTLS